jgi:hypothetical protein
MTDEEGKVQEPETGPEEKSIGFMRETGADMRKPVIAAASTIMIFLATGTLVYHKLEDWSWIESLYFSTFSLTTVGYGDIAPTNDASRLFTVFYLLTGVGAVVASLGVIGDRYLKRRDRKLLERREAKERKRSES